MISSLYNSESAYQAMKSNDLSTRYYFSTLTDPVLAKRSGKVIKIRDDWDSIKLKIMSEIVWEKFNQNKDLQDKLLQTENMQLFHGNYHGDFYWGCDQQQYGNNYLGKILMIVRSQGLLVWR